MQKCSKKERQNPMVRSARNLPARRAFAILLDTHLKRGQRHDVHRDRWRPWTNNDFAAVVGVESPNSVANWRNQAVPMPPRDIRPVLDALFGDKSEFMGHRRELRDAWELALGLLPPDAEEDSLWEPVAHYAPTSLAEAILHQPTPTNLKDTYRLNVTLRFGSAEVTDELEHTVIVSVKEAFAAIECQGYQIAQNSLLGERTPHEHCKPSTRGVIITGPRSEEGHLHGNPIGDDTLATIEPGPAAKEGTVSVTVVVSPRHFTFAFAPNSDSPPILRPQDEKPNRAAILGLMFTEGIRKDLQGRVMLATTSLQHKVDAA
jgi:hypothetical protein